MVRHCLNSDGLPRYHLRRIGRRPSLPNITNYIDFTKRVTLIGRNSMVVDYVLSSASESQKRCISRTHARVIRSHSSNQHRLVDSSFTGVYINDRRLDGDMVLSEGDTVTFGHPQSSQVDRGERVRQPNSEFYFMFELCDCEQERGTVPSHDSTPCTTPTVLEFQQHQLSLDGWEVPIARSGQGNPAGLEATTDCHAMPVAVSSQERSEIRAKVSMVAAAFLPVDGVCLRGEVHTSVSPCPSSTGTARDAIQGCSREPALETDWVPTLGTGAAHVTEAALDGIATGNFNQHLGKGVQVQFTEQDSTLKREAPATQNAESSMPPVGDACGDSALSDCRGLLHQEACWPHPSREADLVTGIISGAPHRDWEETTVTDSSAPLMKSEGQHDAVRNPSEATLIEGSSAPEHSLSAQSLEILKDPDNKLRGACQSRDAPGRNFLPEDGVAEGTARHRESKGLHAYPHKAFVGPAHEDDVLPQPTDVQSTRLEQLTDAGKIAEGIGIAGGSGSACEGEEQLTLDNSHQSAIVLNHPEAVLGTETSDSVPGDISATPAEEMEKDGSLINSEMPKGLGILMESQGLHKLEAASVRQSGWVTQRREGSSFVKEMGTVTDTTQAECTTLDNSVPKPFSTTFPSETKLESKLPVELAKNNDGVSVTTLATSGPSDLGENESPVIPSCKLHSSPVGPRGGVRDQVSTFMDSLEGEHGCRMRGEEARALGEIETHRRLTRPSADVDVEDMQAQGELNLLDQRAQEMDTEESKEVEMEEDLSCGVDEGTLQDAAESQELEVGTLETEMEIEMDTSREPEIAESHEMEVEISHQMVISADTGASRELEMETGTSLEMSGLREELESDSNLEGTIHLNAPLELEMASHGQVEGGGSAVDVDVKQCGPNGEEDVSDAEEASELLHLPLRVDVEEIGETMDKSMEVDVASECADRDVDVANVSPSAVVRKKPLPRGGAIDSATSLDCEVISKPVSAEPSASADELVAVQQEMFLPERVKTEPINPCVLPVHRVPEGVITHPEGEDHLQFPVKTQELGNLSSWREVSGTHCVEAGRSSETSPFSVPKEGEGARKPSGVLAEERNQICVDPVTRVTPGSNTMLAGHSEGLTDTCKTGLCSSPAEDSGKVSLPEDDGREVSPLVETGHSWTVPRGDGEICPVPCLSPALAAGCCKAMRTGADRDPSTAIPFACWPNPEIGQGGVGRPGEVLGGESGNQEGPIICNPMLDNPTVSERVSETPTPQDLTLSEEGSETPTSPDPTLSDEESETQTLLDPTVSERGSETQTLLDPTLSERGSETPTSPDPTLSEEGFETQTLLDPAVSEERSETPTSLDPTLSEEGFETPTSPDPTLSEEESETQTLLDPTVSERGSETPTSPDPTLSEEGSETQTLLDPTVSERGSETPTSPDPTLSEEESETQTLLDPTVSERGSETPTSPDPTLSEEGSETPTSLGPTTSEREFETPTLLSPAAPEGGPETPMSLGSAASEGGLETPTLPDPTAPEKEASLPKLQNSSVSEQGSNLPLSQNLIDCEKGTGPFSPGGPTISSITTVQGFSVAEGGAGIPTPGEPPVPEGINNNTRSKLKINNFASWGLTITEGEWDISVPQGPSVTEGESDISAPQGLSVTEPESDISAPQGPSVTEGESDISAPQGLSVPEGESDISAPQGPSVTEGESDISVPQGPSVTEGEWDISAPQSPSVTEGESDISVPQGPSVTEGEWDISVPQGPSVTEGESDISVPQGPSVTEGEWDISAPQSPSVTEGESDISVPQGPSVTEGEWDISVPQGPSVTEGEWDISVPQGHGVTEGEWDISAPQGPSVPEGESDISAPQGPGVTEGESDISAPQGPSVTEGESDISAPQGPSVTEGEWDISAPQSPSVTEGESDISAPQGPSVTEGESDISAPQGPGVTEGESDISVPQGPSVTEGESDISAPQGPGVTEGESDISVPQGPSVTEGEIRTSTSPAADMEERFGRKTIMLSGYKGGSDPQLNQTLPAGETLPCDGFPVAGMATVEQKVVAEDPDWPSGIVPDEWLLALDVPEKPESASSKMGAGLTDQPGQCVASAGVGKQVGTNECPGSGASPFPSGVVGVVGDSLVDPGDLQGTESQEDAVWCSPSDAKTEGGRPGELEPELSDAAIGHLECPVVDQSETPPATGAGGEDAFSGIEQVEDEHGRKDHVFDGSAQSSVLLSSDLPAPGCVLQTELRQVCPGDPGAREERRLHPSVTHFACAPSSTWDTNEERNICKALTATEVKLIPGGSDSQGLVDERYGETNGSQASGPSPSRVPQLQQVWSSGRQKEPPHTPPDSDGYLWACPEAMPASTLGNPQAEVEEGVDATEGSPGEKGEEDGIGTVKTPSCYSDLAHDTRDRGQSLELQLTPEEDTSKKCRPPDREGGSMDTCESRQVGKRTDLAGEGKESLFSKASVTEVCRAKSWAASPDSVESETVDVTHREWGRNWVEIASRAGAELDPGDDSSNVRLNPECPKPQHSEIKLEEDLADSWRSNGSRHLGSVALKRPCESEVADSSSGFAAGKRKCTDQQVHSERRINLSLKAFSTQLKQHRTSYIGRMVRQFFAEYRPPWKHRVPKLAVVNRQAEVARIVKDYFESLSAQCKAEVVNEPRHSMTSCGSSQQPGHSGLESGEDQMEVSENLERQLERLCETDPGSALTHMTNDTKAMVSQAAEHSLPVCHASGGIGLHDHDAEDLETCLLPEGSDVTRGSEAAQENSQDATPDLLEHSPRLGQNTCGITQIEENSPPDDVERSLCCAQDRKVYTEAPSPHKLGPIALPWVSSIAESPRTPGHDGCIQFQGLTLKGTSLDVSGSEEMACEGRESLVLKAPNTPLKPSTCTLVDNVEESWTDRSPFHPAEHTADLARGDRSSSGVLACLPARCGDSPPPNLTEPCQVMELGDPFQRHEGMNDLGVVQPSSPGCCRLVQCNDVDGYYAAQLGCSNNQTEPDNSGEPPAPEDAQLGCSDDEIESVNLAELSALNDGVHDRTNNKFERIDVEPALQHRSLQESNSDMSHSVAQPGSSALGFSDKETESVNAKGQPADSDTALGLNEDESEFGNSVELSAPDSGDVGSSDSMHQPDRVTELSGGSNNVLGLSNSTGPSAHDNSDDEVEPVKIAETPALNSNELSCCDNVVELVGITGSPGLDNNALGFSNDEIQSVVTVETPALHSSSPGHSDNLVGPVNATEPPALDDNDLGHCDDEAETVISAEPQALFSSDLGRNDSVIKPVNVAETSGLSDDALDLSNVKAEFSDIAEPPALDDSDLGHGENEAEPVVTTKPPACDSNALGHHDDQTDPVNVERLFPHSNNLSHSNTKMESNDVTKRTSLDLGRNASSVDVSALGHGPPSSFACVGSAAALRRSAEWQGFADGLPDAGGCTAWSVTPGGHAIPGQSSRKSWELPGSLAPDQEGMKGCRPPREHGSSVTRSPSGLTSQPAELQLKNPLTMADPALSQLRWGGGLHVGKTSSEETPHPETPGEPVACRVPLAVDVKIEREGVPTAGMNASPFDHIPPISMPVTRSHQYVSPSLTEIWGPPGTQGREWPVHPTRLDAGGAKEVSSSPDAPAWHPPLTADHGIVTLTSRKAGDPGARAGNASTSPIGGMQKLIKQESGSGGEAVDHACGQWAVSGCLTEPPAGFVSPSVTRSATDCCPAMPVPQRGLGWRSPTGHPDPWHSTSPPIKLLCPQSPPTRPRCKSEAGHLSPSQSQYPLPPTDRHKVRRLSSGFVGERLFPLAEAVCSQDLEERPRSQQNTYNLSPGPVTSNAAGPPPSQTEFRLSQSEHDPCSGRNPAGHDAATRDSCCSEAASGGLQRSEFAARQDRKDEEASQPSGESDCDTGFVPPSLVHCWAKSDEDISSQLRECSFLLQDVSEALEAEGVAEQHVSEWREQIKELKEQTVPPLTYVAVVGNTGSGKSSLLNALLDEEGVLPTSAMRACTAVVVEVSHNASSRCYKADIEFFSEEEWNKELLSLLSDMTDKKGRLKKRRPDPGSEASVAYSRVKAVYGRVLPYPELAQIREVTRFLGMTKTISEVQVSDFRSKVQPYIDSRNDSSNSRGGEFWPIVKRVRVQVPNSPVLQTGAVLVDLPGVRDSNAARNSVAKEYLKTCNAVWIVANVTRAVDDKTAKETLDESLRRQLLMDGQFGCIAFICTKTDCHNVTEIMRALPMTDTCSPLEAKIAELRDQIDRLQANQKTWKLDLERALSSSEDGKLAEQLEAALKQLEADLSHLRHKEGMRQRELSLNAIRARNYFCKQKICLNFKRGLQDLKCQARDEDMDSEEDQEESDEAEDEEEDDDVCEVYPSMTDGPGPDPPMGTQLPVFTVSSTEYLKLRDKLQRDGPPRVFHNIEDTEIPAVQRFVHRITLARRALGTEVVIRKLATFISHVVNYLTNRRAQSASLQARMREAVRHCLFRVREIFQQAAEDCSRNIEGSFAEIKTQLSFGKKVALKTCSDTVLRWGSRPPSGLPYPTYKATCSRYGTFSSPACGAIDFNEELSRPLLTPLQMVWNKQFTISIPQHLGRFKADVLEKLEHFFSDLLQRVRQIEGDIRPVNQIRWQQLSAVRAKLENFAILLMNDISARQRSISRILTPTVQTGMTPAYLACASESGPRCFDRMKSQMEKHVHEHKEQVFSGACRKLTDQLDLLKQEIHSRLKQFLDEICNELLVQFEPLLRPLQIIDEIIPKLVRIREGMTAVCARSQVDFTLPKIEESDEEAESATILRKPVASETPPLQELDKFRGKVKMMKINQTDVNPTDPIEITADVVVLKYEECEECVPFCFLSSCEFCVSMPFLILTHRSNGKGKERTDVVVLDEKPMSSQFAPWMEALMDRWQPVFRRLELQQGVQRLQSLRVICQSADNKVSNEEEMFDWRGPNEDVSTSTSSSCTYVNNSPQSRKRSWCEGAPPRGQASHFINTDSQTLPPVLKKEKRDCMDSGLPPNCEYRSEPPVLEIQDYKYPTRGDFDNA